MQPVLGMLGLSGDHRVDLTLNAIQIAGVIFGVFMLHWMTRRGLPASASRPPSRASRLPG
jgi:putative MFS transporter